MTNSNTARIENTEAWDAAVAAMTRIAHGMDSSDLALNALAAAMCGIAYAKFDNPEEVITGVIAHALGND